jgi:YidC/Oxa1 family membrane protein insertase
MDKRTLLAIGLSILVWVGYLFFFADNKTQAPQAPVPSPSAQASQNPAAAAAKPSAQPAQTPVTAVSNVKAEVQQIRVKTAYYDATLSSKGAKIESVKYGSRQIELAGIKVKGSKGMLDFNPLFSEKEIIEGNALQDAVWSAKKISDLQVQFISNVSIKGKPAIVEKTYTFDAKNPSFDLSIRITNGGKDIINFENGTILVSPGDSIGPDMKEYESIYNQIIPIYYANGSLERAGKGGSGFSCSGATTSGTDISSYSEHEIHWFGINSRYFTVLMVPQDVKSKIVAWDSRQEGSYRIAAHVPAEALAPKATSVHKFRVCLAEKEKDILSQIDPAIIPANDVSKWIEPLRNGILFCLIWINKLFGNFGVSIIILSFITKLIFLPLTNKSTESMKRMSQLQPKIAELKEKYKDAPEKLQKATVELYRVHKVNPLGGCLPILIQMPFFIALYSALSTSFGLWNSPFILWIKDLSAPDTLFTVNNFHVNVLPILWAGSTFLQQKMSPTPSTSAGQQWMMRLMPLFLLFIFWSMPSGLTLYWTIQNTLQIAHQWYTNKYKKTPEEAK